MSANFDMISTLDAKNWSSLPQCSAQAVAHQKVSAVILALGSNHDAKRYFDLTHQQLTKLGTVYSSSLLLNPDFTSTKTHPKPDYTNQCVYLALATALPFFELQEKLKKIEKDCNRKRSDNCAIALVTMDIDLLLIKKQAQQSWCMLANRYPFKAHELIGLAELDTINV